MTVANVSAGSWGPGNLAAHAESFGTFGADAAVILLNTHDKTDARTFGGLDPVTQPTVKPFCALTDGLFRYLPRYLPAWLSPKTEATPTFGPAAGAAAGESPPDRLGALLDRLRADGVRATVMYHPFQSELRTGEGANASAEFRARCEARGVRFVSLEQVYRRAGGDGRGLFRDYAHLNADGQRVLARELLAAVRASVANPGPDPGGGRNAAPPIGPSSR